MRRSAHLVWKCNFRRDMCGASQELRTRLVEKFDPPPFMQYDPSYYACESDQVFTIGRP